MGSSHWYDMKSCQAFQCLKIYQNLFRNAKPKQSVKIRHKKNLQRKTIENITSETGTILSDDNNHGRKGLREGWASFSLL